MQACEDDRTLISGAPSGHPRGRAERFQTGPALRLSASTRDPRSQPCRRRQRRSRRRSRRAVRRPRFPSSSPPAPARCHLPQRVVPVLPRCRAILPASGATMVRPGERRWRCAWRGNGVVGIREVFDIAALTDLHDVTAAFDTVTV